MVLPPIFLSGHDKSKYSVVKYLVDVFVPDKIMTGDLVENPEIPEFIIERHAALAVAGRFLNLPQYPTPYFSGTWSKTNNGQYEVFILAQKDSCVSGIILDRLGPAVFSGTLTDTHFTFDKTYLDEVVKNTDAMPGSIRYTFSSGNGFKDEVEGSYNQGPEGFLYTGKAFIQYS